MDKKPNALHDYTYCLNRQCMEKVYCARYAGNYKFNSDEMYSYCYFDNNNCIESEGEDNATTNITNTDKR